jgi:hypothetical protein
MAMINITTNDPQGLLGASPLLLPTIRAAVDYLDQYIVFKGNVDIVVNVESTPTGRFAANGDISFVGVRGGLNTWESSLLAESRNGVDPNPNKADLSIDIDPTSSYLASLWWDPAIGSGLSANPPNNRTDALTVVLHELMHGMGIIGWRDITTGALPGNYQSVWDSLVTLANGRATFGGAATLALLGQPLEVRLGGSQGAFHLGNGPTVAASSQPWTEQSNFNGYYYFDGERYTLGRLELALLQDLGWTLKPGITLTDVVNRWDDRDNQLYMVGWDNGERLVGGALADRIEGRGGNDTMVGNGGNDTLIGGTDIDTAVYAGVRSNFTLTKTSAGFTVSDKISTEGTDTLQNVERLKFSDTTVALDIDGNGGQAYRVYQAAFNRTPDSGGLGFWINAMDSCYVPI